MEISEVKVKLMGGRTDRLKAFCSVTIDDEFVIRDLKIIEGPNGVFVAMPSRKVTDKCTGCGAKNHLRAKFCNECGARLDDKRAGRDADGRAKLHADIAHPINSLCRDRFQKRIIGAFVGEVEKSKLPGYRSVYDEDFDEVDFIEEEAGSGESRPRGASKALRGNSQERASRREGKAGDKDSFGEGIF